MHPIEIGIVALRGLAADRSALRKLAAFAEAQGVHSIWVNEHIVVPARIDSRYPYTADGRPQMTPDTQYAEAFSVLAYLAALTAAVRLGTSVIPMTTRHPLFLAKQAATLDRISNGRLELGIGSGWMVEEADVLAQPTSNRGPRLLETLQILRAAWSEQSFSFRGDYYSFAEVGVAPRPLQLADLPIWIGGTGEYAVRASAKAAGNLMWLPETDDVKRMATMLAGSARVAVALGIDGDLPRRAQEALTAGATRLLVIAPSADRTSFEAVKAVYRAVG
jgi:probable F420-dependent oxidoreductase